MNKSDLRHSNEYILLRIPDYFSQFLTLFDINFINLSFPCENRVRGYKVMGVCCVQYRGYITVTCKILVIQS